MTSIDPAKHKTCKRYDAPGHAHELTFTCFHRMALLSRDRSRQWLVDAIERARIRHEFDVWAYVIMPEHVHLLVFPRRDDYSISTILKAVKWPVARWAMQHLRAHAPAWIDRLTDRQPNGRTAVRFWQRGGGYGRNIMEELTLPDVIEYIHNNPLRRGLVADPIEWRWSGAAWYRGGRDVPLKMDDTLPVIIGNTGERHVRL